MSRSKLKTHTPPPGQRLVTHASPELVKALDAWIEQQPEPRSTRAEVLRLALTDWLALRLHKNRSDEADELIKLAVSSEPDDLVETGWYEKARKYLDR